MISLLTTLALAAEGEHGGGEAHGAAEAHGIPWDQIAFQSVAFVVFIGLLVYFARRPIGDALKNRALEVSRHIEEAQKARDEASARYAEIESRLVSLDRRVEEMKAEAAAEAEKEAARIRERGHEDAARIQATAERTIREEGDRARTQLRAEAVSLAVQLARESLKRQVTPEDQERLARDFLAAVDKRQNGEA
jgi:F-type H+-transporting ATPase subunit b